MTTNIVLLPGDGIGPEIVSQAQRVLEAVGKKFNRAIAFQTCLIGGIAIDQTGDPLPAETVAACRKADAILLGAVGGRNGMTRLQRRVPKPACYAFAKNSVCLPTPSYSNVFRTRRRFTPSSRDRRRDRYSVCSRINGGHLFWSVGA